MKNPSKVIKLSSSEFKLIDTALIAVLTIAHSDSEQFDYVKSRCAYLFDFIGSNENLAINLFVKIHER